MISTRPSRILLCFSDGWKIGWNLPRFERRIFDAPFRSSGKLTLLLLYRAKGARNWAEYQSTSVIPFRDIVKILDFLNEPSILRITFYLFENVSMKKKKKREIFEYFFFLILQLKRLFFFFSRLLKILKKFQNTYRSLQFEFSHETCSDCLVFITFFFEKGN